MPVHSMPVRLCQNTACQYVRVRAEGYMSRKQARPCNCSHVRVLASQRDLAHMCVALRSVHVALLTLN